MSGRRLSYDEVDWEREACAACRSTLADGLLDGCPLCFGCAGIVVERLAAVAMAPRLRELLPPLSDVIERDPWA